MGKLKATEGPIGNFAGRPDERTNEQTDGRTDNGFRRFRYQGQSEKAAVEHFMKQKQKHTKHNEVNYSELNAEISNKQ